MSTTATYSKPVVRYDVVCLYKWLHEGMRRVYGEHFVSTMTETTLDVYFKVVEEIDRICTKERRAQVEASKRHERLLDIKQKNTDSTVYISEDWYHEFVNFYGKILRLC